MIAPERRNPDATNARVRPERVQMAIVLLFAAMHAALLGAAAISSDAAAPCAAAAHEGLRIEPNTASAVELELLPGIGPALAGKIIEFRTASGTVFERPGDLDAVPRIGPGIVERIAPYLRIEPSARRAGSP